MYYYELVQLMYAWIDTMATKYLNLRFKLGGILMSEIGLILKKKVNLMSNKELSLLFKKKLNQVPKKM
ncbi:hypothetical protein KY284_020974 [Solanum tuberosum]|nr:hypothetical protein KY284_020974 [Solanum tuberosum]